MKRYLIITSLDVLRQPNNREHHLLRHIAPRFAEAWVVYRKRNPPAGGRWRRASQLLLAGSHLSRSDGDLMYLEVDPMFNSAPNTAMDMTKSYAASSEEEPERPRNRIYNLLNGLGILKDLSFVFFMFLFILIRVPGRFDIGVGMGPFGNAVVYLLTLTGKVRCRVYEDRDYEPGFFQNPLRRSFVEWLERAGVRSADLVISIGSRLAALRKLQSGRSVPVVTTGVDYERYHCEERTLTNEPELVYIGNVTFWSGLEVIIEGFALVRERFPGAKLRVVGEGLQGYRLGLETLAQQHGVADAVDFTGRVENREIPGYLSAAHLGIALFRPMRLRAFAFPLKLLEYMAAGLPVVGNHDMETEDVIRQHDIGACVDYNAEDFASSCIGILSDPERYQRYSGNARRAAREYDWSALMEREYDLLVQACAGNKG